MFMLRLSVTVLPSSAGQTMLQQGTRSPVTLGWSGGSTASGAEAGSGRSLWLCHCCHSVSDSVPLGLEAPGSAGPCLLATNGLAELSSLLCKSGRDHKVLCVRIQQESFTSDFCAVSLQWGDLHIGGPW